MKKQETFEELLLSYGYRYDLRIVFEDFLTMVLCAFAFDPLTQKSHYEDLYLETIRKNPSKNDYDKFPVLLSVLVIEMTDEKVPSLGYDVLGSFYEKHLYRKGASQFFTPWPICKFMAKITTTENDTQKPLHVIDPCCGAGRMLVTSAHEIGKEHYYYGINIDLVCVKMTVINLFLNGCFYAEVMCANALTHDDFIVSYKISFLPFGIFRIDNKEDSSLWHMYRESFVNSIKSEKQEIVFDKEINQGEQLNLF